MLDADFFRRWLTAAAASVDREADHLTELDSAIGDADHGSNLQRGFTAVTAVLEKEAPDDTRGRTDPGGTAVDLDGGRGVGPAVRDAAAAYGQGARRRRRGDAGQLAEALRAGVAAVAQLGGAKAGDKTMLDALEPAVEALGDTTASFAAAREAAEQGALATVPLQARKGRASYLGERSIGHQDPGATSSALLIAALQRRRVAAMSDGEAGRDRAGLAQQRRWPRRSPSWPRGSRAADDGARRRRRAAPRTVASAPARS